MRARRLVSQALLVAGAVSALACSSAQAAFLYEEVAAPFGSGYRASRLAIEQESGNLYMNEGYQVHIVSRTGEAPVNGAPESLTPEETPNRASFSRGVAIDNSCYYQGLSGSACEAADPSNGDVYVAAGSENAVDKFHLHEGKYEYVCQFVGWGFSGSACHRNASGREAQPTEREFHEPEGVTVDTHGNVYVANFGDKPMTVYEFGPAGSQMAKIATTVESSTGGAGNLVVDQSGDVYISPYDSGQIVEMKPVGKGRYEQQPLTDACGDTLAVDVGTGAVYAARGALNCPGESILEYDSQLAFQTDWETAYGTEAIAVDAATHDVLTITEGQAHTFAPGPVVPGVALTTATFGSNDGAVNGTVNPSGLAVTKCEFELKGARFTDVAYQKSVACTNLPGSGSQPVDVSGTFSGLTPNTEYEESLLAEDEHGANRMPPKIITTLPALAVVTDEPVSASGISRKSVSLTGAVNPQHSQTSYYFVYGTTIAYGQNTAPVPVGSDLSDHPVQQTLQGLEPGTTYHYALAAVNPAGTTVGPDNAFTTSPALAPSVSGLAVTDLAPGAATVSGTVSSNGLATTYEIDFGPSTDYGAQTSGETSALSQSVSLRLLYLAPNTTYHYRIVVRNEDGSAASPDETFTTPAYPLLLPEVLPQVTAPLVAFPAAHPSAGVRHKHKAVRHRKAKHRRRKHTKGGKNKRMKASKK